MDAFEWDLLKGIPKESANRVLGLGSQRILAPGSTLFSLGDEATHLFLVVRGKANLTLPIRLEGTHKSAVVEERSPGQLLGWSGIIPPHRYTLQAITPVETELLALPRTPLLELFSSEPELGYAVLSNIARIIGQRLQLFQTMWVREMQRAVEGRSV